MKSSHRKQPISAGERLMQDRLVPLMQHHQTKQKKECKKLCTKKLQRLLSSCVLLMPISEPSHCQKDNPPLDSEKVLKIRPH